MEVTPKTNRKEKVIVEREAPLKGTWFACGIVGAVILVTYILFFSIYTSNL